MTPNIQQITQFLKEGKIILLPTETVYTFAVDATNADAIKKVYYLKGRDFNKPLHVIVDSLEIAANYVEVSKTAQTLADKFLPGPLTLVLPKKPNILPGILTSNLPTLGIRIPNLDLCLQIAKEFGSPFTTTSANISGGPNPYSVEEVLNQFPEDKQKMIDLIVDIGPLPNLAPSTLLDLTVNPPKILRQGPVTEEQITKALEEI